MLTHGSFREPTPADRRMGVRVLVVYVLAISLSAGPMLLLDPALGLAAWLVLVALATFLLVRWNARHSGYRCAHCGHEFPVSVFIEMVSPQGLGAGGWKYLRCPRCDRKSRARALVRID